MKLEVYNTKQIKFNLTELREVAKRLVEYNGEVVGNLGECMKLMLDTAHKEANRNIESSYVGTAGFLALFQEYDDDFIYVDFLYNLSTTFYEWASYDGNNIKIDLDDLPEE